MTPFRDECDKCEFVKILQGHEKRISDLEEREGAILVETRATRDAVRSIKAEITEGIRSLVHHIHAVSEEGHLIQGKLKAIEEAVLRLTGENNGRG